MTVADRKGYAKPGTQGSIVEFKKQYGNWIGGDWKAPVRGQYFDNPSPVDGQVSTPSRVMVPTRPASRNSSS